jgi:cytochrome c553
MKRILLLTVLAGALAASGSALAAEAKAAVADVQQLVKRQCGGCHGEDGNGVKPAVPKLAGQHADYLYKQLRNFKAADGKLMGPNNPMYPTPSDLVYVAAPEGKLPERMNPVYFLAMNGMVMNLSDAEMKAIAVYFSEQKIKPADAAAKGGEAFETAKKLYRWGDPARGLASCAGCHGPRGAGLPAQFPRLSGQFAPYTMEQLKSFRAGDRTNDPNSMMRDIAYKLTESEIADLADYIAGLR